MHFFLLYVTFALTLLVSSTPLHGNGDGEIEEAVTISPRAINARAGSPPRGKPIKQNCATPRTPTEIPSASTTLNSRRLPRANASPKIQPITTTSIAPLPSTSTSALISLSSTNSASITSSLASAFLSTVTGTPTSCPANCRPKRLGGDRRRDSARVHQPRTVQHLSGHENIILFHGMVEQTHEFRKGIILEEGYGDLHDSEMYGVDGGFYMTDSIYSAAQFACQTSLETPKKNGGQPGRIVSVAEFQWIATGFVFLYSASWSLSLIIHNMKVKEFKEDNEFRDFLERTGVTVAKTMADNDMISSPMHDPDEDLLVTEQFWQYAVIKNRATKNLIFQKDYTIDCGVVQVGLIKDEVFTHGQKTKANVAKGHFKGIVDQLTSQPKRKDGPDEWQNQFDLLFPPC